MRARLRESRGQSLLEFALILPILCLVALGVVEVSYLLLDQHVVTKLSREGSNLISRSTSLGDAGGAMRGMATRPVDFGNGSKMIFSVIMKVDSPGQTNHDKEVLYARYEYGTVAGASSYITTRGSGSFGGAPDYTANNPNTDSNLQITNLPEPNLVPLGGFLYVTEIYSTHPRLTPLDRWGVVVPQTLYSIAYF